MKNFVEDVRTRLEERLDTKVEITPVKKQNQQLTGITIGEGVVRPTFYAEDFFGRVSVDECVTEIVNSYRASLSHFPPKEVMEFDYSFDSIKDKLFVRLVGIEKNKEFLDGVVHRDMGCGLAVVPVIEPYEDFMVTVTNGLAESSGYDTDLLIDAALACSATSLPAELVSMEQALCSAVRNNLLEGDQKCSDPMMVLTNSKSTLGAAVMFYGGVLEKIREIIGSAFYVLPSSIHEVIIVPDGGMAVKDLKDMVVTANSTVVDEKDILTDDVYRFDEVLMKVA